MTERSITVSASYSRKVNLGNYESKDYWHSESRELPADSSQEAVDRMRAHLHKTVVDFVERQIAPQKPPERLQDAGTLAEAKTLKTANKPPTIETKSATGDCRTPSCARKPYGSNAYCYPCSTAYRNGAVPAKPKEVIPDTPDGAPFP